MVYCKQECVTLDAAHPELGEQQIRRLCVSLLPGWAGLQDSSLQVRVFVPGIGEWKEQWRVSLHTKTVALPMSL